MSCGKLLWRVNYDFATLNSVHFIFGGLQMESAKSRIYFAHAVNTYGQPIEKACEILIQHCFPESIIENPNQPHHQAAYNEWVERTAENRDVHNAMQYFYTMVLPELDECVAMPFFDGRIGLGVAGEAKKFINWGRIVWFMEPKPNPTPADIDEFIRNPQNDLFRIRPFTDKEVALILAEVSDNPQKINLSDAKFVVQHQETRLRTWKIYNKEKRPYEEAHLVKMSPDGSMPEGFYPPDTK